MRKLTTLIILVFYSSLAIAKDLPPPGKDSPCHPVFGCPGSLPIDDYIPLMIFVGLLLGAWFIQQRHDRLKAE